MNSRHEGPLDASALRAEIANLIGTRTTVYALAEQLDRAGVMSRNEIAAAMAGVRSRPTILAYLRTRSTIAAVAEDLRAAGLDGVFNVSGPGPQRPDAHPVTLAMSVSPADLEDPGATFARLRKTLAKRRLVIVVPGGAQPEPAADLGMPADSPPAALLLAGGEVVHLEPKGPNRVPPRGKKYRPGVGPLALPVSAQLPQAPSETE